MTLPAHDFWNPLNVLIAKENSIEKRVKGCMGCKHLLMAAWDGCIFTECERGRKVGRKSCDIKSGDK